MAPPNLFTLFFKMGPTYLFTLFPGKGLGLYIIDAVGLIRSLKKRRFMHLPIFLK